MKSDDDDDRRPLLVAMRDERERVIAALCEGYAADLFDDAELERRMDLAHRAGTLTELKTLAADLPAAPLPPVKDGVAASHALVPVGQSALVAAPRKNEQKVVAIFGNATREGSWSPAAQVRARAVFGNVVLDFREARLPPGLTEVHVSATFGNVEIIVPPGLAVETDGSGIFGNFEHVDRAPPFSDPDAPLLRVQGRALFGNVELETRLPGESGWKAWKRRKRELKRGKKEE